jgi:regulatory protein
VGDLSWHPTWTEEPVDAAWEDDIATVVDDAEAALIKRLRTRSLSEREASRFLRERELGDAAIDHVIDRMRSLGYLDDSALAEQLVRTVAWNERDRGARCSRRPCRPAHPARGHRRGPRCAA